MTSEGPAEGTAERAERAIAGLAEMSLDLRACAILAADGSRLAASAEADWEGCAARLWESAADPDRPAATQVHVATENGEVFLVSGEAGVAIAVSERFALASLMFCDLRASLREVAGASPAAVATGSGA